MFSYLLAAAILAVVNAIDWQSVVRRALHLAGYSVKAACLEMEIDAGQFERQLSGEGHLSVKRLAKLSPSFWQWFSIEVSRNVGLPEELQHARALEEAADFSNERLA